MWIWPIIDSVNSDHLLKVVSATFLPYKATTFPLQIISSLWGDTLGYEISYSSSNFYLLVCIDDCCYNAGQIIFLLVIILLNSLVGILL